MFDLVVACPLLFVSTMKEEKKDCISFVVDNKHRKKYPKVTRRERNEKEQFFSLASNDYCTMK
jgi:hypothetical protein